jgi:cell wall-associated NlpC family hydrolase
MDDFLKKAIGVPWTNKGRDYAGWDCWGLIVRFYGDVFGIDIRKLEGVSCRENPKEALRELEVEAHNWPEIPLGSEQPGDVAVWRPLHTGIVIAKNRMIHCDIETETCLEYYNTAQWRFRLIGFYRHASLAK